jgi:hypothetical protein
MQTRTYARKRRGCWGGGRKRVYGLCDRCGGSGAVTFLNRDACYPQEVEEVPHRMRWHLESSQNGTVLIEDRWAIQPVEQARIIDPAEEQS